MDGKAHTIYYFPSTHWDREWCESFQGYRYSLIRVINEAMDVLVQTPALERFFLDGQTIVLEDFVEIEPEKKSLLAKLVREGRFIIGPLYMMPDEFLVSGESLIRNLMFGHRIAREWGVEPMPLGYFCDIFGHIGQLPQILNGFGVKNALVSRGTNEHTHPAFFRWQSPDGSECITFKLSDRFAYGSFRDIRNMFFTPDTWDAREQFDIYITREMSRTPVPIIMLMDGSDCQSIHPEVLGFLDTIRELCPGATVKIADIEEMVCSLLDYRDTMPVKIGELYDTRKTADGFTDLLVHTLSSRYPLKQVNDECQSLLEKWVEPFTAIAALLGTPTARGFVDLAYKYLLKNQPHDSICGCSLDQVHRDMEYRYDQTKEICHKLLQDSVVAVTANHPADWQSQTMMLTMMNPLPFSRREVVTVDVSFSSNYPTRYTGPMGFEARNSFRIYDYQGNEIPYGIVSVERGLWGGEDAIRLSLEVSLPALGAAHYKIVPSESPSRYLQCMSQENNEVENEFIALEINDNGTINICDKSSGRMFEHLLSYLDDGETGDGYYHYSPIQDTVVSSFGSSCTIERIQNGPSRTVFRVTHHLNVPEHIEFAATHIRRSEARVNLKICSLIGLSKGSRYVDIETTVTNNAKDHRLRLHMPTGIATETYFASQAFLFNERQTGVKMETHDWPECDTPEKQMAGIVGKRSSDGSGLAFISAYGLHEAAALDDADGTIAVTLFRSFRRTPKPGGEPGGQIQGDLHFKYCLLPMQPETSYADLVRIQDGLQAGVKASCVPVSNDYDTPSPKSYFEISESRICMSILKRPESKEANAVIMRLCNMSARPEKATVKCFREMREVVEVSMNEDQIGLVESDGNTFVTEHSPWRIRTYLIRLEA